MELFLEGLIGVLQRSQQSHPPASESGGPPGALRCLSWLPACLFALNLSVLWPCWQGRKWNCERTLCMCVSVWGCRPSFRRHSDKTHLPAKTEGLVRATRAQTGTNTAHLTSPPPFNKPFLLPSHPLLHPFSYYSPLLPSSPLCCSSSPSILISLALHKRAVTYPALLWSHLSCCKQMSLSTVENKKMHTLKAILG